MKKTFQFLIILAALAAFSGYLMSQMSFIGRVGINLMHNEYKFLKVWWQGALVVYFTWLILFLLHTVINRVLSNGLAKAFHALVIIVSIYGMYFTYSDFSTDFSHSLLKQRFHLGAYIFWIGWILICLFYLMKRNETKEVQVSQPIQDSTLPPSEI